MNKGVKPASKALKVVTRQSDTLEKGDRRDNGSLSLLSFTLDDSEYGVDLSLICQIVKPPALTWVPRAAPYVLGIVSIRGAVVTLVDMRQLMGLAPTEWPRTAKVLIVEIGDERVGLLVDSVTQVRRVTADEIELKPSLGQGARDDRVLFLTRPSPDDVIVAIDLDLILGEALG